MKPFEAQSGCKVQSKNAGSSNELVAYMRQGKYDLGAVSADVGRTLIGMKAVAPLSLTLVPAVKSFLPPFRSPVATTVGAAHFGVAIHWAPDELLYNRSKVKPAPTSWGAIYGSKHRGQITIPNDPMQIADAALYLMTAKPSLGIRDPYELTTRQLAAAVALLQRQRPLLSGYWNYPADEVQAFQNGHAVIGGGWPWQAATLKAAKVPVNGLVPREGVTGWIDSWMVAAKDKHPNCAYRWLQYTSTPPVQAMMAKAYGAAPVNAEACGVMDRMWTGSCEALHGNPTAAYLNSIRFWKTPLADCGRGGAKNCTDYTAWQQAWSRLTS